LKFPQTPSAVTAQQKRAFNTFSMPCHVSCTYDNSVHIWYSVLYTRLSCFLLIVCTVMIRVCVYIAATHMFVLGTISILLCGTSINSVHSRSLSLDPDTQVVALFLWPIILLHSLLLLLQLLCTPVQIV